MTILEIKSLDFAYNGETVLEDVNLNVRQKDFMAIIGPNGGGKTTLLKLVLGLLTPMKGTIRVDGKSPQEASPCIGYVPQDVHMNRSFPITVTVPRSDLFIMVVVGVIMTILVVYYYQDLLAMSYDEEFARIRGVPVKKLYFGLIGMLAIAIVLVIQVVGLILVIALLTIPPFIVEKYAKTLVQMMVASSLLGAVFTVTGLWISYRYNLTSGASIIMVSGIVFLASLVVEKLRTTGQK